MKRFSILMAALLITAAMAYGYSQTRPRAAGQEGVSRREVISTHATREIAEIPKGESLVEELPEGVEGVELKEGVVRIMPGYKFEKKDNKVTVMRSAIGGSGSGRLGVGGSWLCVCRVDTRSCSTKVEDNQIYCAPGGEKPCGDKCILIIMRPKGKAEILKY